MLARSIAPPLTVSLSPLSLCLPSTRTHPSSAMPDPSALSALAGSFLARPLASFHHSHPPDDDDDDEPVCPAIRPDTHRTAPTPTPTPN